MRAWVERTLTEMEAERVGSQTERERLDRERTAREEASTEWESRLRALGPFGIRTGEVNGLLEQEAVFAEAQTLFATCRGVEFPFGKIYGLEQTGYLTTYLTTPAPSIQ